MNNRIVVFTDLDETLLERRTYSFEKAMPALALLQEKNIPLVICSSKTRVEVEVYRKRLENSDPFITENGGGIYVPRGYFEDRGDYAAFERDDCSVIILGTPYSDLRNACLELRAEGFDLRGFGDMSVEEISELTGLSLEEAALSRQREFDEAFVFSGDTLRLEMAITEKGLKLSEGRLFHLMGDNDKGKAVDILKELYSLNFGKTAFIALGDSPTDTSMLRSVDYPVLVMKDNGEYDNRVTAPGIIKAYGSGPEGWNRAVIDIINKLS